MSIRGVRVCVWGMVVGTSLLGAWSAGLAGAPVVAEAVKPPAVEVTLSSIHAAVTRSLALIESSGAEYRRRRECFSCHHQALPVLALVEARGRGFEIDEENLAAQLQHTAAHLERGQEGYVEGRGQGGQADTAGWALWALEEGGRSPDETTATVASYLLTWQSDVGHWRPPGGNRPPTQGSDFTTTYVVLRGLDTFGTLEQADGIESRRQQASAWLSEAEALDTEDLVFRLRTLSYVTADDAIVSTAAGDLLESQQTDGGWGQTASAASDAYATGTALVALHDAGVLSAEDAAYRRGLEFLLRGQNADGSWRVPTRAKPIQAYFESGFPHGKDQFISMAATCWATVALLRACPQGGTP